MLFISAVLIPEMSVADVVQIPPSKDNTLYENATGSLSNGAGQHFFVGRTNQTSNSRRRGIIAFNLSDSIPEGSIIQSAALTVYCSKSSDFVSRTITLRKVINDWGEGTSDAAFEEGAGGNSTVGSATWIHRFYSTSNWTSVGGDFLSTISGSATITGIGSYTFVSTAQLVADAQSWLDNPSSNYGWVLLGTESVAKAARRFDTKEHPTAANRPYLTVTYLPPSCCVGIRGDFDGNGTTADIQDLTYLIDDIYRGGPSSPCPEEADLDNNGTPSQVQDLTYLINDLFRGGPNPPDCQ